MMTEFSRMNERNLSEDSRSPMNPKHNTRHTVVQGRTETVERSSKGSWKGKVGTQESRFKRHPLCGKNQSQKKAK